LRFGGFKIESPGMTNKNFPNAITITRQYANIISFLKKEYASYDKHDKHRLVTRRPMKSLPKCGGDAGMGSIGSIMDGIGQCTRQIYQSRRF